MDAPAQAELPLAANPARCTFCGRSWPGVFDVAGADLGAMMRLPPVELAAAERCWLGQCREAKT